MIDIQNRLNSARERINRAAARAGRRAEDITLIAVSKTFDASLIQRAVEAGAREFGENRVQEAVAKAPLVEGEGVRWHLIGHLQSNKARAAVETFDVIHSIDSLKLVERLDRIAGELNRRPVALVQVDLGHEAAKTGAAEEELPEIIEALDRATHLDFRGLMTLPPFFEDAEEARSYFRRLREIRDAINRSRPSERRIRELSMGMSHDFEVAIEEGATMVRVGTAIFGERVKP
jgi:hypothetical protein